LDLWPNYLGPKPTKELSLRHDAAGLFLFDQNAKLEEILEGVLPGLFPSKRLVIVQAVCGHHGEPIERRSGENFRDLRNPKETVGNEAQQAAIEITKGIVALLSPAPCHLEKVSLISYWLSGLVVLADWLGSNQRWFEFQSPPLSGDLASNLAHYWEIRAKPDATRALKESGPGPGADRVVYGSRSSIRRCLSADALTTIRRDSGIARGCRALHH
jgi:CRISPR-associated endonuclease/helicase Cas3